MGARLHTAVDWPTTASPSLLGANLNALQQAMRTKADVWLEVAQSRPNTIRLAGVVQSEWLSMLTGSCTGPLLFSTGFTLDTRLECVAYTRSSVVLLSGGQLSCSLVRMFLRSHLEWEWWIFTHCP